MTSRSFPPCFPLTARLLAAYCPLTAPHHRPGVAWSGVDAKHMQSKRVPGLFFAGRLLLLWTRPLRTHAHILTDTWLAALTVYSPSRSGYPSHSQASCSTSTASRVAITSSRAGPRAWWQAPRRPRWHSPSAAAQSETAARRLYLSTESGRCGTLGYAARGFMCLCSLYVKRCDVRSHRDLWRAVLKSHKCQERGVEGGYITGCAPFSDSFHRPHSPPCRDASCESCLCCFLLLTYFFRPSASLVSTSASGSG